MIADASGNLYGATYYGGVNGQGVVFELRRQARGTYVESVLYSFKGGSDGSAPTSTLVFGAQGELFGTTSMGGGYCNCGTIFKVSVKSGRETVLHDFGNGSDGAFPYYGLTKGASGQFYGTTVQGGASDQGTIFVYTN